MDIFENFILFIVAWLGVNLLDSLFGSPLKNLGKQSQIILLILSLVIVAFFESKKDSDSDSRETVQQATKSASETSSSSSFLVSTTETDSDVTEQSFLVDVIEKDILLRPAPGITINSREKIKQGNRGLRISETQELDGLTWGRLEDGRGWIVLNETSWAIEQEIEPARDPRNLTESEVERWVFAAFDEEYDGPLVPSDLSISMFFREDDLLYILLTGEKVGSGQEYRIDSLGQLQLLTEQSVWSTVSLSYHE